MAGKPHHFKSHLREAEVKCFACYHVKSVDDFEEQPYCDRCGDLMVKVVIQTCMGCGNTFPRKSIDNYRYCPPCKDKWVE